MSATARAVHAAVVVVAGLLGISGTSSTAVAQRPRYGMASAPQPERVRAAQPRYARTAQPERPRAALPRFGTAVIIDTKSNDDRRSFSRLNRDQRTSSHHRIGQVSAPAIVYYVPVPSGYDYYPSSRGYGGGVYDTDGRPLYEAYERQVAKQYESAVGTPDLGGSPYVVTEGGAMVVDFGNGYRRTVASCGALAAEATPDGHPRTLFYQPPADGIILRPRNHRRVGGPPPPGPAYVVPPPKKGGGKELTAPPARAPPPAGPPPPPPTGRRPPAALSPRAPPRYPPLQRGRTPRPPRPHPTPPLLLTTDRTPPQLTVTR